MKITQENCVAKRITATKTRLVNWEWWFAISKQIVPIKDYRNAITIGGKKVTTLCRSFIC